MEHAYAVTAWALSLLPDIRADCMERFSTDNGDLRKLIDEVVSQLHYPPCPNKKVASKSIDEIIDIFGKNSNTLLTELDLTAIDQVALKMMMPSLADLTFGMKCIPSHSLKFLVLLYVKLRLSVLG